MQNRISYEWDAESVDEHGDIQDHHAVDTFAAAMEVVPQGGNFREVVLVRQTWNEVDGVRDRAWAYYGRECAGLLPEDFDDGHEVPQRFHDEVAIWHKNQKHGGKQ